MPVSIAGHTFGHGHCGTRCTKCDRSWAYVLSAQPEDIGQELDGMPLGYACSGKLSPFEYEQIVTERERVAAAYREMGEV